MAFESGISIPAGNKFSYPYWHGELTVVTLKQTVSCAWIKQKQKLLYGRTTGPWRRFSIRCPLTSLPWTVTVEWKRPADRG
jgi:hypothetical protein